MDISSERWLSELELEDDFEIFNQCQTMCGFDTHQNNDFTTQEMDANETSITSFDTRPTKYLKTNYNDNHVILRSSSPSSSSQVLTFGNTDSPPASNFDQCAMKPEEARPVKNSCGAKVKQGNNNKKGNLVSNKVATTYAAQDHIMAERRRREKLSQRFIALSALVPGLKKMDKASVLGDAIKHLKQLQERVDMLEEQTKKRTIQSAVFVNKAQLTSSPNSNENSSCSSNDDHNPESLPEIEARVSDRNVLLRIHCEKNKGVVVNVVSEIEKMNLSVVNSSALPFGTHALDITVVAQMDNDFCLTVKELVNNLRLAFLNRM